MTRQWLVIAALLMCSVLPAFSSTLNLVYEQVVKDSWGNEIGYRSVRITSPDQLPTGSPWRTYLNTRMPEGKTIFEYARDIAPYLSKPLNLTLSDRNSTAFTSKSSSGYNLNLYNYINSFAADTSKTFLFLHELGHVAMLNAYPTGYDFSNLDYGSDSKHYLDEILPNDNTAWVEGWGNAFAASKNNGMVFSFNLNSIDSIAFLKNNSFGEMSRNELFVAKVLYDSFNNSKIPSGKDKVFNAISKTGPHYSLREFCRKFVTLYPDDRVALARILVENSHGRITLNEMLDYINNGSRTVSRDLYNYMAQVGLVAPATGNTGQPSGTSTAATGNSSNNSTTTTSSTPAQRTSIWGRIASWFSGLFGRAQSPIVASPSLSVESSSAVSAPSTQVPANGATAPEIPDSQSKVASSTEINDLGKAQEAYYQAFAEYNRLMASSASSRQQILEAQTRMIKAKEQVKLLQSRIR